MKVKQPKLTAYAEMDTFHARLNEKGAIPLAMKHKAWLYLRSQMHVIRKSTGATFTVNRETHNMQVCK